MPLTKVLEEEPLSKVMVLPLFAMLPVVVDVFIVDAMPIASDAAVRTLQETVAISRDMAIRIVPLVTPASEST